MVVNEYVGIVKEIDKLLPDVSLHPPFRIIFLTTSLNINCGAITFDQKWHGNGQDDRALKYSGDAS